VILIILASIFLIIVIGCIIELIRNNRAYKRRQRQEDEMWMPPKYTESVLSPPVKMVGFKSVSDEKHNFCVQKICNAMFSARPQSERQRHRAAASDQKRNNQLQSLVATKRLSASKPYDERYEIPLLKKAKS
jgi:hypothetical protein